MNIAKPDGMTFGEQNHWGKETSEYQQDQPSETLQEVQSLCEIVAIESGASNFIR